MCPRQLANQPRYRPKNRSVPKTQTTDLPTNQLTNQMTKQAINHQSNQPPNNQPTNQPDNNQPANLPAQISVLCASESDWPRSRQEIRYGLNPHCHSVTAALHQPAAASVCLIGKLIISSGIFTPVCPRQLAKPTKIQTDRPTDQSPKHKRPTDYSNN